MMESSVNAGMCRCCASEGAFKDIKSTYHWMGEEEVYADMLRECFDIILNASEQAQDGGICEVCITQLRNAINFKKQVLHTEDQFQKHLQNKTLFRPNIVKVEVQAGDDSDDNVGSGDEGFSGPEFEVPIKTEVDDPKPKKRAAAKASATTTRASAKKAKADNGETSTKRLRCDKEIKVEPEERKILEPSMKPTSAKANVKKDDRTNTVSKKISAKRSTDEVLKVGKVGPLKGDRIELEKHLQNIRNILLHSNATPIRRHTAVGYHCSFCLDHFTIPRDLKIHTLQNHDKETKCTVMKGCTLTYYAVKLDITGLKCEICSQDIGGLEPLIDHLQSDHNKSMHRDIKNHILPFIFQGDTFKCVLCPNTYESFKLIQEHMNVHYNNYICEICNSPYVNKITLNKHLARHKKGEFSCKFCPKVFDTNGKKLAHENFVHKIGHKRNKCVFCNEKFTSYMQRNDHMVTEHGAEPRILKCMACDKTFTRRDQLLRHHKRDHLLERKHECEHCDMKFYRRRELTKHMLKHTGEKQFKCDVCLKAFGRKHTLKEHMRIHTNDRRFKCDHCGQAFVQKCSWRSHMRTRHDETV